MDAARLATHYQSVCASISLKTLHRVVLGSWKTATLGNNGAISDFARKLTSAVGSFSMPRLFLALFGLLQAAIAVHGMKTCLSLTGAACLGVLSRNCCEMFTDLRIPV